MQLSVTTTPPFGWLRVEARVDWQCSKCHTEATTTIPVLVDWLDRSSAREQRRVADGLPCARCDALEPVGVPLLQYRQGDVVGLVVGFPARSATEDDEAVIRDVLAAAGSVHALEGAGVVAGIRMAWWGSVWNRPLGPRLVGSLPLVLPESDDEAQRWRLATVEALALPDVRASLRAFFGAEDESEALEALGSHPELVSSRWRLTVETLVGKLRDDQPAADGRDAVDARASLLRQAHLLGPDGVAGLAPNGRLTALADAAIAAEDWEARLDALRTLTRESTDDGPLTIAAHLALVEAMHGDRRRGPHDDGPLIATARRTLQLATDAFGADHELTTRATLNLAVCVEERRDVDPAAALAEAHALLADLAPRAARSGSPATANVATNLAGLAARRPGSRADNPEDAAALLADAAHLRSLLFGDRRRDMLVALVDEAATLRSRVSGSLRANAAKAVELLREALAKDSEWRLMSDPEQALTLSNLSNALSQLHARAPMDAPRDEVRDAAHDAIDAADRLDARSTTAIQVLTNAGGVLIGLYGSTLAVGRPETDLWSEGRDALERAYEATRATYPPHHPETLRAAVNLASACGSLVGDRVADPERCAELLEEVIEHAGRHQGEFRLVAATNLAQLRMGEGEWDAAADAYETAGEAQRQLLGEARTYDTRLGEIVDSSDLAARRALALSRGARHRDAVAVLEANRMRLARPRPEQADGVEREPAKGGGPGTRATVHVAASAYGTIAIVERPSGEIGGFYTDLASGDLKPLIRSLLEAPDRDARRRRLDVLMAHLSDGIVAPLAAYLEATPEAIDEIALIACGTLASCPWRCVPAVEGLPLGAAYAVRELVSAASRERVVMPSPRAAVAVIDPDGSLPFARAEREALGGWADSIVEPPPDQAVERWLTRVLPEATVAHLACHGRLDPEDPMRSRFEVGADAHVTVADLSELRTPELDLVVAPACQSASASPDAPDELLGIAHVLAHAGARVVVASIWDADDAATALVIARLYAELGLGAAPSEALSLAQRWVAGVTGPQLATLSAERLAGAEVARWLPYDLAIELSASSAHPEHQSTSTPVFGHPADWASLSCLEA